MGLPRFRVRALLILVMLAALVSEGYILVDRSLYCGRRARHEEVVERTCRKRVEENQDSVALYGRSLAAQRGRFPSPTASPARMETRLALDRAKLSLERAKRAAEYQRGLKEKYLRAARYPWLPVAPDPPVPE